MDLRAKPGEQSAKFAAADFVLKGMLPSIRLGELRSVKTTQGIGGKIAKHARRPVHILEYPFAIRGRRRPDQRRAALIPNLRQIANAERAGDQRYLELVAQYDVQMIGDLVRCHTVYPGPHQVDAA